MPSSSLRRFALVGVGLAASGCVGVCPGTRPSCEGSFPAARLAVHEGGRWFGPRSVWSDATGQLRGDLEDGSRWSVAALGDRLAIGHPQAGRITLAEAPGDEEFLRDAGLGEWADGSLGFATAIAAARPTEAEAFDLWVGAPGASTWRGELLRWRAAELGTEESPSLRITGASIGDELGSDVLACGDVTGDGRTDWLTAAPGFSGLPGEVAPTLVGAAVLIRSDRIEDAEGTVDVRDVGHVWRGAEQGDGAGVGLACGADLTGDGRPDVVVGAPWAGDDAGIVYIVSGAAAQRDGALSALSAWRIQGPGPDAWFGAAIAAGDFDGDGVVDLAIGAPGVNEGVGQVFVYDGRDIRDKNRGMVPRAAIGVADPPGPVHLGKVLAAGKIGQDPIDDLVVGVPDWLVPDEAFGQGRALVFDGAADWPAALFDTDATRSVEGGQGFQRIGRRVVLADLDGDGTHDLLLPTGDKAPP